MAPQISGKRGAPRSTRLTVLSAPATGGRVAPPRLRSVYADGGCQRGPLLLLIHGSGSDLHGVPQRNPTTLPGSGRLSLL